MYSSINITLNECELEFRNKYSFRKMYNRIDVDIVANENEQYSKIITDYNKIKCCLKSDLDEKIQMYENEDFSFLESLQNKENDFYKNIFDNIKYVSLDGEHEQILTFLKNNSNLKDKEIVLVGDYSLGTTLIEIAKLEQLYKDYKNINVILEGNKLPVRLGDFKKTVSKINDITNEMKKYNFSELEQIMYAYDIARDALYVREDENESILESRDLTNVLFGDKRVCEGYANIFNAILTKLNIRSLVYRAYNMETKIGHAYNCAYIDDEKYKVKGIYFFDPTFDNRKDNTNNYLYSYKCFALNKKNMERIHGNRFKDGHTFDKYTDDDIKECLELIKKDELENVDKKLIKTINMISHLINKKSLISIFRINKKHIYIPSEILEENDKITNDELIDEIKKIDKYMNGSIDLSILVNVLYNVRKIQYYNYPEKYPFDTNNIKCVVYNSRWKVKNEYALKLFEAIFGEKNINGEKIKSVDDIIEENNIDLNIERVKLTKTLRKVLENNNK